MKFGHLFIAPKDYDESFSFYSKKLKMKVLERWGDKPHRGCILKSEENFVVVIAEEHPENIDSAWSKGINPGRPTVHLEVENLDSAYADWKNSSEVVIPPEKTHWGSNWFVVSDPDRNLIAVNETSKTY
jgi:catechol 2,3-dioxygenase-like lactoylglutathione lyase family enzyme